jgi:hypothetical protein
VSETLSQAKSTSPKSISGSSDVMSTLLSVQSGVSKGYSRRASPACWVAVTAAGSGQPPGSSRSRTAAGSHAGRPRLVRQLCCRQIADQPVGTARNGVTQAGTPIALCGLVFWHVTALVGTPKHPWERTGNVVGVPLNTSLREASPLCRSGRTSTQRQPRTRAAGPRRCQQRCLAFSQGCDVRVAARQGAQR